MTKAGVRVWLELRKELGRSSNLVWVGALLVWFCFSSSRYSEYVHRRWLSGTHQILYSQDSENFAASSPITFSSLAPLRELHETDTNTSQIRDSNSLQKRHTEPGYDHYDVMNDNAQTSHFEEALAMPHSLQGLHPPTENNRTSPDNGRYLQYSESKESDNDALVRNSLQAREETTYTQGSYMVQISQEKPSPPKSCATVEEMGILAASSSADSSLQVRKIVKKYFSQHGASSVRALPAKEFCQRGFVFGRATEDGLGNDLYKILTAAGLSIMLNRSLIIAEHGSANPAYFGLAGHQRAPFGDYLIYSNETFSFSEVKHLWVKHNCAGEYRRPLTMIVDDFQRPTRTKVFCENWTKWRQAIIWFKGTTDSNALQFFLKNQHVTMRESARLLFGDPSEPSSRANVFGELFKAFISPRPVIEDAVNWALQGRPDPDVAVHMRMLNSRSWTALYAVCSCVRTVLKGVIKTNSSPSIVVVSDTPRVIPYIKEQLDGFAQVIHFDHKLFMASHHNLSKVMSGNYSQPPEKRVKDWGAMPRWVAIVDMFLGARARVAVISGANRRVGTTYVQLVASLATAARTDEEKGSISFKFYSSFQTTLLVEGLAGQRGWGHVWRRFAGDLSCKNQAAQCALTPILSYAWWDGPWQSPAPRDIKRMLAYGIKLSRSGLVEEGSVPKTCMSRKARSETLQIMLPSCKRLKLCHQ